MANITPGPWTVDPKVSDLDPEGMVDGGFYARSVTAPGAAIAEIYWHGAESDAETAANARLIAKAPELLAAVRELIGCADPQRDRREIANARRLVRAIEHPKMLHGLCPVCGHHGDDCTGEG